MGTSYCLICDGPIPASRKLTCSHECYIQLKFHKEEFKKDITKKPDTMQDLHVNIKRKPWQKELDQWTAKTANSAMRVCEFCGKGFIAKNSRSYFCSPLCYDLKKRGLTQDTI